MAPRSVKEALSVWTEEDQRIYDAAEEVINKALDRWRPGMEEMWVGMTVSPRVRQRIAAAYSDSAVGWVVKYTPNSETTNEGYTFSVASPPRSHP